MNIIFRRFLALFLSLMIVISSTQSAFANTSIGGWTAVDALIAGANTTINATKTAGGKVLTSAVTIAPQAGKVGKYLLRGGAVGALALAVPQLIGDGVDWVLDPANNRIKYTADGDVGGIDAQCKFDGKNITASALCAKNGSTVVSINENGSLMCSNNMSYGARCQNVINIPPSEQYIPIDTVAAKVISNAAAGHAPSQEAVKATALEGFAAGEHDVALESAAVESDVGTENPTDPNNPTDPADPAAPFDPSSIIAAINALKALLAGILSSITSLTDFFKSDPPPEPKPEDTELDIPLPDLPTPDTDINFGGSCPANFEFKGSIFGNPINIVLLDTAMFCDFLSTYVKYPVYAASSLFALYIIGGRKDV